MAKERVIQSLVAFYSFTYEEAEQKVSEYIETHQLQTDKTDMFSPSAPDLIAAFD